MEQIVEDSPAATAAWPLAAITEDVPRGVREIDVPTLVVGADHDVVEPLELLREHAVAVIPGARLVEIPDCGHP
jgi:pimeloyl-ACP methyl ester carboxylesterase